MSEYTAINTNHLSFVHGQLQSTAATTPTTTHILTTAAEE